MRALFVSAAIVTALAGAAGQVAAGDRLTAKEYEAVLANPDNETLFNKFLAELPTLEMEQGGALRRYYVVEGDLRLSREEVRAVLKSRGTAKEKVKNSSALSPELIIMVRNGRDDFWPKNKRAFTYALDRPSFPDEPTYKRIRDNFAQAAQSWVATCSTCGISFTHRADLDRGPKEGQVTFIIRHMPQMENYIALGFFPSDPVSKRYLLVFPNYNSTSYDAVGVFRHEIGHILGYRHEQLAKNAGCFQVEEEKWRPLSAYDPKSVMHYWCVDEAQLKLAFSETDKTSHRTVYGGAR